MKMFQLNSGFTIPSLGFGTWKIAPEEVGSLIELAIETGYRHIDCAATYANEPEVGVALAKCFEQGAVKREDLFITSKLWNTKHHPEDVRPALIQTLQDLQLEYLDLYLIHWPVALVEGHGFPISSPDELVSLDDCPTAATWAEMEKLVDEGLVRSIGVSNFSAKKLHELAQTARIQPAVNQMECHPYLQLPELHRYCDAKNIHMTGYSSLGSQDRPASLKQANEPLILEDPAVQAVAQKHGASNAQVLLNWAVTCGTHSVLCKSSSRQRMQDNLSSLEALTLDDEDKAKLKALDKHRRYVDGSMWVTPGGAYTMENLWDEATTVDSLL